jgi:hypothetical protein
MLTQRESLPLKSTLLIGYIRLPLLHQFQSQFLRFLHADWELVDVCEDFIF